MQENMPEEKYHAAEVHEIPDISQKVLTMEEPKQDEKKKSFFTFIWLRYQTHR